MKRIILLVILGVCWATLPGSAQSYFNTRSTNRSFANVYSSVIESNGKFYCTGVALDSLTYQQPGNPYIHTGIRFTVTDKNGAHIRDTIFQLNDRDLGAWTNNLRRLPDGTFLVAAYDVDTFSAFHQLIVNFDSMGHALWYKELSKITCGGNAGEFWRLEDFRPTGTGEWLMLASEACHQFNNQADYNLIKLDSAFNIIWEKTYGDATQNNYGGKLLIDGNTYIMAGGLNTYNVLPHNTTYQAEIFRLDTAGNIIVHKLINNSKRTDAIKDIIKTQDGGYVYCGQGAGYEMTPQQFFTDIAWKGWVQKLDAAFNPVWADTFSALSSNIAGLVQLSKLIELPDATIMVGGAVGGGYLPTDTFGRNYGALIKLRSDGGVVWARKYAVPGDTLEHKVYDMKQTSDGGFILAGEATDALYYPYVAPTQRAWLIKVDSNGCSSANDPQCWPVAVPHSPRLAIGEYKVYPNPVSDALHVSYTKATSGIAMIQLYDLLGRIISESPLDGASGNKQIDVRNFQSGVYLYRIIEGGITKQQGKVTKQ